MKIDVHPPRSEATLAVLTAPTPAFPALIEVASPAASEDEAAALAAFTESYPTYVNTTQDTQCIYH